MPDGYVLVVTEKTDPEYFHDTGFDRRPNLELLTTAQYAERNP